LLGVFSSSNAILSPSVQHRIPGAVDTGPNKSTEPTYFGKHLTDIPEDFLINQFGEGNAAAQFLILGFNDSYFGDNRYVHPDGSLNTFPNAGGNSSFGFKFVRTSAARVPQPSTLILLGSGLVIIGGLMRNRRRK